MDKHEYDLLGPKTKKTLSLFTIGNEVINYKLIKAIVIIKKACCIVNYKNGLLDDTRHKYILAACDLVLKYNFERYFKLTIWQCGSGTQINMNVNEVLANIANKLKKKRLHVEGDIDPIEHVNLSQSTNDVIPTAMNMCFVITSLNTLLPNLEKLATSLQQKSSDDTIKLGRTHIQDAVPLTVGQEFSGYYYQVVESIKNIKYHLEHLYNLVQGGTCIGTGINTPPNFDIDVVKEISNITKLPFKVSENKFAEISSHDAIFSFTSSLNRCAISLMKISDDLRYLSAGPVAGMRDYIRTNYEVGSSSMPGKVNPTRFEMMSIVCVKIMGICSTVNLALTHGNFQLNIFKPLMANEILDAINILGNSSNIFAKYAIDGLSINEKGLSENLSKSNILITKLNPIIGYNRSTEIYNKAMADNLPIRDVVLQQGIMTGEEYDKTMDYRKMIKPASLD